MTVPDRRPVGRLGMLVVVVVLAAAMLRGPILSVAPVAGRIGADLGVDATVVGLLTSIPVLCFAVCAPPAIWVIRRMGADSALTVAMAGAVVGCLVRSSGGVAAALVGTAVLGAFVTVANIVIPMIVAREYHARRAHTMTGVYTAALNVGTMTVMVATDPLAQIVGWRGATASWAVFGLAALAFWVPLRGWADALHPRREGRADATGSLRSVLRGGGTWALAVAFAGQAFAFYATTAWLPTLLADRGFSGVGAGAVAAVFQIAGVAGSLLLPVLTIRSSVTVAVVATAVGWVTVPVGVLALPALLPLWCATGGLAQGAGITVMFIMLSGFHDDERTAAARSGVVQGVGYAVAAVGPTLLGGLHELTGGWTWPMLAVLASVVGFVIAGLAGARALRAVARMTP